jgi:hypothetical protein
MIATKRRADEIIDFDKINRFTKFAERNLSPQGVKFYNELLDEVVKLVEYTSTLEMDNEQLHYKLIESVRFWRVQQQWISEDKFTKKQSVINYADVAVSKIIKANG